MKSAPNLVLIGPTGAGKTCIGRRLADQLGLVFVDSDAHISNRLGLSVTDIFAKYGEECFRALEHTQLCTTLRKQRQVIATGAGAVLTNALRHALSQRGFVVYLDVSIATQIARLACDRTRPLILAAKRQHILAQMDQVRRPLYREIADVTLTTDALTPSAAALQLHRLIAQSWPWSHRAA